jgi:hypothetical protein
VYHHLPLYGISLGGFKLFLSFLEWGWGKGAGTLFIFVLMHIPIWVEMGRENVTRRSGTACLLALLALYVSGDETCIYL